MARNLIMGKYYCASSHTHSSAEEVEQCNRLEVDRQKREYDVMKQNNENINTEHQLEKQRLDIEQERLEIEKQKQQAESLRQKQEYEKHMAEMELKKLQIERDKKQMEYDEKMANIKIERQKQKTESRICVVS